MITLRNVLVIFAVLVVGTLTIIINNVQFAILGCFVWLNSSVLFFFYFRMGWFFPHTICRIQQDFIQSYHWRLQKTFTIVYYYNKLGILSLLDYFWNVFMRPTYGMVNSFLIEKVDFSLFFFWKCWWIDGNWLVASCIDKLNQSPYQPIFHYGILYF